MENIVTDKANRRWPRVRQLGKICSVPGCDNNCVSNDLCTKHNMQSYRKTEKGKAYIKNYNKRYKRLDINKVCAHCGKTYKTSRRTQKLCSVCTVEFGAYEAQKKHRARARDIINKRIKRGTLKKEPCEVCFSDNTEAHHPDYSKPLDIMWLCREHHTSLHSV